MTLIYSSTAAALAFWLTYLALTVLDGRLILDSVSGQVGQTAIPEQRFVHRPGPMIMLVAAEFLGLLAAAIGETVLPWRWPLLVVGLTLAWAGFAVRLMAKRTLGHFFVGAVVIQDEHRVVTTGPYAVIRHPGYAGSILSLLGLGIATGNGVSLAIFALIPTWIFLRTIGIEERALTTHLGQPYTDYRQRTSRLIPRVW